MKFWLFKGDPKAFNIDSYFRNQEKIYWGVKSHRDKISLGDTVFFWRIDGNNAEPGIIARATVDEEPKLKEKISRDALGERFWISKDKQLDKEAAHKAGLLIHDLRLTSADGMITQKYCDGEPLLRSLKFRQHINSSLKKEQVERINAHWNFDSDAVIGEIAGDHSGKEGKVSYRNYLVRERDPSLRRKLLAYCASKYGDLRCELCYFRPDKVYEDLGKNLLEVHHKIPLSKFREERKTELSDLMLVCPNCHRAIHKGDAEENLKALKKMFKSQRRAG